MQGETASARRPPTHARRPGPDPLRKRLLFVVGKGGVGKSTVAAVLGTLAVRRGLRTLVAEVAARDDVSRTLTGATAGEPLQESELSPGLFWTSVEPEAAMEEYLVDQLPVRALAELVNASRMFTYLAAATPGLRELLTVGKLWELAQPQRRRRELAPYDLVVVDAPATGHALAYLTAPRTFSEVARTGPIARQALRIHTMLADPTLTGVVAVTTPHELPVTETLALRRDLRDQMGYELDRVVVNQLDPARFSTADVARLRALRTQYPVPASAARRATPQAQVHAGLRAALSAHDRARDQRRQVDRLRRATGRAPARLATLFRADLGAADIERLADQLEAGL